MAFEVDDLWRPLTGGDQLHSNSARNSRVPVRRPLQASQSAFTINRLDVAGKADHEKGAAMTEENLPDEELNVVQDDDILLDQTPGAASSLELDPVSGEPDSYPGAAENNPDRWQEDPLLQEEPVSGEEEDFLSEQTLRDETGGTTDSPTIGEAAADVVFGEAPTGEESDASDDDVDFRGSPLSQFDPDDPER